MAEQGIPNPRVGGSNPSRPAKFKDAIMRVFIKESVILSKIRKTFFDEIFKGLLDRNKVRYTATPVQEQPDLMTVILQVDDGIISLNLSEEDGKVFYNTLSWGSSAQLRFDYLGDMRFDLHI